jgi:hypothetical protein
MRKIQDVDRITLINLYKKQVDRFGLQRWLKHSAKIVKAAHKRLNIN